MIESIETECIGPPEPSDTEVLEAVQLWAEASGLFRDMAQPRSRMPATGWWVEQSQAGLVVGWDGFQARPVNPDTALVWALAVISGRKVDAGKCSACKGSGTEGKVFGFTDREAAEELKDANQRAGWTTTLARINDEYDYVLTITRPCTGCGGKRLPFVPQVSEVRIKEHQKDDIVGVNVDGVETWVAAAPLNSTAVDLRWLIDARSSRRSGLLAEGMPEVIAECRKDGIVLTFVDDKDHDVAPIGHAVEVTTVTAARPEVELPGCGRDIREAARLVLDAAPPATVTLTMEKRLTWYAEQARALAGVTGAVVFDVSDDPKIETGVLRVVYSGPAQPADVTSAIQRCVPFAGVRVEAMRQPGDLVAIELLTVFKDEWESEADPLGLIVANWLREFNFGERIKGWRREALAAVRAAWERMTVPCKRCDGRGRIQAPTAATVVRFSYRGQQINAGPGHRLPPGVHPPVQAEHLFRRGSDGVWFRPAAIDHEPRKCPDCNANGRVKPQAEAASTDGPITVDDLNTRDDRAHALLRKVLLISVGEHMRKVFLQHEWSLWQAPTRDRGDGRESATFVWMSDDHQQIQAVLSWSPGSLHVEVDDVTHRPHVAV